MKNMIKKVLRRIGYDIVRYRPITDAGLIRRIRLFNHYGIDVVLDVGANVGQYASQLRKAGYHGKIVSFEPLSTAFSELQRAADGDSDWKILNMALGDENGSAEINVAANSFSSSLLEMLPVHKQAAPDSVYVGKETIAIRRLDSDFERLVGPDERVFMKIDTQGFERQVLEGAGLALGRVCGLQLEMSLVALYSGESLFRDMWDLLLERGYTLMSLEPGFSDPVSGRLLQVDGVFFRAE